MTHFDVAHIREQGVDLIIVPLNWIGHQSQAKISETQQTLQVFASRAGLKGTVVPVWDAANGGMYFAAPPQWRSFFNSINWAYVKANINRRLTCG